MERTPKVGDPVVFVDESGRNHNALITAAWTPVCVNVVLVSADEAKRDDYGRQIERRTSVMHGRNWPVHGMYWRWPDETPNPAVPPISV